jgi:hypothetical protein
MESARAPTIARARDARISRYAAAVLHPSGGYADRPRSFIRMTPVRPNPLDHVIALTIN